MMARLPSWAYDFDQVWARAAHATTSRTNLGCPMAAAYGTESVSRISNCHRKKMMTPATHDRRMRAEDTKKDLFIETVISAVGIWFWTTRSQRLLIYSDTHGTILAYWHYP